MARDFVAYVLIALLCSVFERCACKFEPYVVGGSFAEIRNYPHAVYLSAKCQHRWFCGASILNQRILLTATHCLFGCDLDLRSHVIISYAGHEDLDKVRTKRSVIRIAVHKNYNGHTVANDIGLALVKEDFPFGNNIKRISISRRFPTINRGEVAGWGAVNEETHENTRRLKSVSQTIRSKAVCSLVGKLEDGMFCAGSTSAEDDHASRGDSGSAFVVSGYLEIGLVSFRVNNLPALMVYTNVTYYYDWINTHSKRLYCMVRGK